MIRNILKTAFRNLWRNKGFTVINISGLALGLAVCLLIALFVNDEFSYDQYNKKADRIYRLNTNARINGSNYISIDTPEPLGPTLKNDYPQIENYVRLRGGGKIMVKKGSETVEGHNSFFADSTLFDVFTLPMIQGNPQTALTQPHSIVLSESMAKKYFNTTDVIGKTLHVDNTADYKITGVIKDMSVQSSFHLDFIRPMSELQDSRSDDWLNTNCVTFLLVRHGTTRQSVENYLRQTVRKYVAPRFQSVTHNTFSDLKQNGGYFEYQSMPLTRIHLHSTLPDEFEPTGNIQYVYIFIVIALLILLIACVNFINLSTARAARRAKEVGIRKALGSNRSNLIAQFITESFITSFISLFLALIITLLLLPYFNQVTGKAISITSFLSNIWLFPGLLLTSISVGLLAGSYPAFILSSFNPSRVLKGNIATGFKNVFLRNGLVIFQFATTIILIVGTLVIYNQLNYIQNKKLGYNRHHVLIVRNIYLLGSHARSFKNEIQKMSGVEAVTLARVFPTTDGTDINTLTFSKDASINANQSFLFQQWPVDADYIPTLDMKMKSGRNFSPEMPTDSSAVIINETAANMLGYKDPLQKKLYKPGDNGEAVVYHIIGVVKDFNAGSLHKKNSPDIFTLAAYATSMGIRIHTNDIPTLISKIKDQYHVFTGMSGQPFTYSFMDNDFNRLFRSEQRTGKLFIYFTFFSIFISCLGLFGLISYVVEQRTKEIGIRKVLGASVTGVVALLSKDFLKLVGIGFLIAVPIGWYAMHRWLENFAYHINIGIWTFVLAGVVAMVIALTTVSWQSVRAAIADPVKSLRNE